MKIGGFAPEGREGERGEGGGENPRKKKILVNLIITSRRFSVEGGNREINVFSSPSQKPTKKDKTRKFLAPDL